MSERPKFVVVFEKSETGFSAYVPDLPGLGVAGDTMPEVEQLVREGIEIYLEEMKRKGDVLPRPTVSVEVIEVSDRFAHAS